MIKIDPQFERFKEALYCKQPDRVPLFDFVISKEIKEKFLGKPITNLEEEVEFWVNAGYDFVVLNVSYPYLTKTLESQEKDGRQWRDEHVGLIGTMRDFETYPWPDPKRLDYSELEEVEAYLPKGMKVVTVAGNFYETSVALLGFENFVLSLVDNIDLVERVFNRVAEIAFGIFQKVIEMPTVGAIVTGGDIAYAGGTMVNPEFLKKYVFPWYKKQGDIARINAKPLIHHSDGNLWKVMDDLIETGINAFHPFEPKAMDINQVKKRYGNKICILGNINVDDLSRDTPDKIEAQVKKRIQEIGKGGGYCVASSNSIPNYVKIENYRAMINATFKYGRYLIKK